MKLQKLNDALALFLTTFLLCGVAIYNGYPLVFPDTGSYIGLSDNYFRSISIISSLRQHYGRTPFG